MGLGALLLAGAAAIGGEADAFTLYYAGGEDTSVTFIGTAAVGDAACANGSCRSTFARESLSAENSTTVADPPANRIQVPTFTAASSLWIHARFDPGLLSGSTANEQGLLVRSPDGVSRIVLRQTGTYGQIKVSTRNAAGTITDLATASSNFSAAAHAMDLQVNYTCSSSGGIALYIDGTSVISYSGNPCTDSATTLNQVEFASLTNGANGGNNCGSGGGESAGTCWSEFIIADSSTLGMGLWTLAPQAAGNTQSWTPNTVGDVNPTTINDSNFVSTGSNNALSEWTTPTSAPSGTWNVLAIVQEARVLASTSGPSTAEWLMRTKDGTDHVTGSFTPPVASFGNFNNQIWTTNPNTSVGFVIGDIASGFNLGIESTP